jgi:hypothetical protein
MTCNVKRTSIVNLFIKEQSTDAYEAPIASNIVSRLSSGFTAQATPEVVARDNLKASFTPDADIVASKTGTFSGQSEMYGADYTDGTTKPWFNPLVRSIQLKETKVTKIPVSAISVDFVHNEVVTGSTSGAVGRVVVNTTSTDNVIYIILTSGVFQAETITGSISGSATATGVDTDAGWSYKYDSTQCVRLSSRVEEDGQKSELFNAVPTLNFSSDASGIPYLNYELSGVINEVLSVPQWMRDTTMTTVTRDTKNPPLFQSGRVKYDAYSPVVDSTITIDPQITNPIRVNANADQGLEGYIVTDRNPIITMRIDRPENSDADIMLDWFNSESVALQARFGKDPLNTFWFFADSAKLENVAPADQDGFAKLDLSFKLTGQDDQEFELVCI